MSDKLLEQWIPNHPSKDGDKVTISGMTEPIKPLTIADVQKYTKAMDDLPYIEPMKIKTEKPIWHYYGTGLDEIMFNNAKTYYLDYFQKKAVDSITAGFLPDLEEPSKDNGGSGASAFVQHYWGTETMIVNNISITKLLVGYAEHVRKQLTEEIVKDFKKQQRDACVPRHKRGARKFRPA